MGEPTEELGEVSRQLRAIVAGVPAESHQERATAHRIEGAAAALEALAEGGPKTNVSETPGKPRSARRRFAGR